MDNESNGNPAPVPSDSGATPTYLRWPPPGLEPIHGRLLPAVGLLGLADIVLVLPLMSVFATQQDFWSPGGLGSEWWVSAAVAIAGLFLMLVGFDRINKILKAARGGARLGHSLSTMLLAAGDSSRDTGFLLQGTRSFGGASAHERKLIVRARLVRAIAYLGAVVWPPVFLALGIVAAARGLMGPAALWFVVVVVPLFGIAVALFFGVGELVTVRALKNTSGSGVDHTEDRRTVDKWYEDLDAVSGEPKQRGSASLAGRMRLAYIITGILAVLIVLPVFAVVVVGSIGPIMGSIAIPVISQRRLKQADVLRRYRLPSDSAISELAAGEALNVLLAVGGGQDTVAMLPPVRSYDAAWFPVDRPESLGEAAPAHIAELFQRAGSLSQAELGYLEEVATHPAQSEWRVLGRAAAADILASRYELPFDEDLVDRPFALPIPRYSPLRVAGQAHVAAALLDANAGRTARAEEKILEVLSAGFLLIDDGPFLLDNIVGSGTVAFAADALTNFYRSAGRADDAETIEWMRAQIADMRREPGYGQFSIGDVMREMMATVSDTNVTRGLRWDHFMIVNSLAPCMNFNKVVFGTQGDLDAWIEGVRESLVVRPSDEYLFDLYRYGFFGAHGAADRFQGSMVPRLTRIVFGSSGGMYECVSRMGAM